MGPQEFDLFRHCFILTRGFRLFFAQIFELTSPGGPKKAVVGKENHHSEQKRRREREEEDDGGP